MRVVAGGVVAAAGGVQRAFVDVEAVLVGLREAGLAGADEAAGCVGASLVAAVRILCAFVNVCNEEEVGIETELMKFRG